MNYLRKGSKNYVVLFKVRDREEPNADHLLHKQLHLNNYTAPFGGMKYWPLFRNEENELQRDLK